MKKMPRMVRDALEGIGLNADECTDMRIKEEINYLAWVAEHDPSALDGDYSKIEIEEIHNLNEAGGFR